MGMDIRGGMIVGRHGWDMKEVAPEDEQLYEWADDNEMDSMSLYYDASEDDTIYGFTVENVSVNDIDEFAVKVKDLGKRFKDLTGLDAVLYGTQDVV